MSLWLFLNMLAFWSFLDKKSHHVNQEQHVRTSWELTSQKNRKQQQIGISQTCNHVARTWRAMSLTAYRWFCFPQPLQYSLQFILSFTHSKLIESENIYQIYILRRMLHCFTNIINLTFDVSFSCCNNELMWTFILFKMRILIGLRRIKSNWNI